MSKANLRAVPPWILQALLALMFLLAGGRKLVPGSPWPGMFSRWGYPDHFYLVIGVIEVLGAGALLVPRLAGYAASLLAVVMIGALATHLFHGERQAIVTAVVFVLLLVVAGFRRPGFLRRRQKAATVALLAFAIVLRGRAQQDDKPAEQVYKNIQVFKGVPAGGVQQAMAFMSASLGVNCPHCHVPNQFEKDDKKPKETARGMIRMMQAINKDRFSAQIKVNCYTCHRGQLRPATIPEIAQRTEAPLAPAAKSSEPLPTVDQVLANYVEALGGKAAIEKVTTRHRKGVLEAGPMRIPLETFERSPNKSVMIGQFPNGRASRGYDGRSGWEQNPNQPPRAATGESLDQLRRDAEFYPGLRLKELYQNPSVKGREKVGEHEGFLIEAADNSGAIEKLYFDAATRLLVRKLAISSTPLGTLPSQVDFEDYRPVGAIQTPFVIRQSRPDVSLTTRFEQIEHNIALDDNRFAPPAAKN